jgi:heme A synthase
MGGYLMLALLAATGAAAASPGDAPGPGTPRAQPFRWTTLALLLLVFAHAASGGMISAQYALTACSTLAGCPGTWFGELAAPGALDPFRALSVVDGRVVPPPGGAGLHVLHRALGIAVVIATFALAYRMRRGDRRAALLLLALAAGALALGVAVIVGMPSLAMTVLHNATAALLVAALAYTAARDLQAAQRRCRAHRPARPDGRTAPRQLRLVKETLHFIQSLVGTLRRARLHW